MSHIAERTISFVRRHTPNTFRGWMTVFGWIAIGLILLTLLSLIYPVYVISNFEDRGVPQSTKIYDRTGTVLLYDLHGNTQRMEVPLNEIPQDLKDAVVAIEDHSFYEHDGISARAIARAVVVDVKTMSFSQGGSTITQQVVKNSLLNDNDKSPIRKAKEMFLALLLERKVTKDQILEAYLNETAYGGMLYGVEEASQTFFGKSVSDLTLAESAYIAALPKAPTFYSPYGKNRDDLDFRKDLVLDKMVEHGYITEQERDQAKSAQVTFQDKKATPIRAPHFVFYVKKYLEGKYGEEVVSRGGLVVRTSLDWDLQQKAEETVARIATQNAKNYNATNAGLVAIDPNTGQILAMVGSRDYFSEDIEGMYNVTTANRQPGSSFKPIVYATAFEKGYTPDTIVFDLNTQFSTLCEPNNFTSGGDCYAPKNYDNQEHGPVTFRDALGNSLNIASVKVLYLAGIQESINTAKRLGITTLEDPNEYGLSLVLGGGAVNLLEMTSAYAVFADDGFKHESTPIAQITDSRDRLVEAYQPNAQRVLDDDIAHLISSILADNDARLMTFGYNSPLNMGNTVAVKTGTSDDYRDVWTIGYNDSIVVGVWAGNNDNSEISQLSSYVVAPMWREVMSYATNRYRGVEYPRLESVLSGSESPMLSGNFDFSTGNPNIHSILHWIDKDNPRGPRPSNPSSDPQYERWEYSVTRWAQSYFRPIPEPEFINCWDQTLPDGSPNPYYTVLCIRPESATTTPTPTSFEELPWVEPPQDRPRRFDRGGGFD